MTQFIVFDVSELEKNISKTFSEMIEENKDVLIKSFYDILLRNVGEGSFHVDYEEGIPEEAFDNYTKNKPKPLVKEKKFKKKTPRTKKISDESSDEAPAQRKGRAPKSSSKKDRSTKTSTKSVSRTTKKAPVPEDEELEELIRETLNKDSVKVTKTPSYYNVSTRRTGMLSSKMENSYAFYSDGKDLRFSGREGSEELSSFLNYCKDNDINVKRVYFSTNAPQVNKNKKKEKVSVKKVSIDDKKHFTHKGFVLTSDEQIVVGKATSESEMLPLSEKDKQAAKKLGLDVLEPNKKFTSKETKGKEKLPKKKLLSKKEDFLKVYKALKYPHVIKSNDLDTISKRTKLSKTIVERVLSERGDLEKEYSKECLEIEKELKELNEPNTSDEEDSDTDEEFEVGKIPRETGNESLFNIDPQEDNQDFEEELVKDLESHLTTSQVSKEHSLEDKDAKQHSEEAGNSKQDERDDDDENTEEITLSTGKIVVDEGTDDEGSDDEDIPLEDE